MTEAVQSIWSKFGKIIAVILIMLSLGLIIKYQHDLIEKQTAIQDSVTQMKQLGDGIIRNQSQYVSKDDLDKFAKQANLNLDPIKKDLSKLGADIQGIGVALIQTPGYNGTNLPSNSTVSDGPGSKSISIPCPGGGTVLCTTGDPYGYLATAQVFDIKEPLVDKSQVPFGSVEFRAWQNNPWSVTVLPRTYSVDTVLGQDENGKHYVYNKFTIEVNKKTYPVTIKSARFVEKLPEASFSFNPRLFLGLEAGVLVNPSPRAEVIPNLEVALFSYGQTKLSPDWVFLGLGLGYESQTEHLGVLLSPVKFNVGHHLPLVTNLFVGPSVTFDTAGGIGVMGGLSVGL